MFLHSPVQQFLRRWYHMSFTFQGGNCPLHPLLGPRGPPCFSWARSTLGLRVSLPSAVDVCFLALCVAHRLPPSKHHSPVAFPDLMGCRARWLPALPSTLHIPFTHFVVSIALSTSQHSAFVCLCLWSISIQLRGPACMLSCWGPSTGSRNRHSQLRSESTSVTVPCGER